MLATISYSRYENVKKQMERCLSHVIGEPPLEMKSKFKLMEKTRGKFFCISNKN